MHRSTECMGVYSAWEYRVHGSIQGGIEGMGV